MDNKINVLFLSFVDNNSSELDFNENLNILKSIFYNKKKSSNIEDMFNYFKYNTKYKSNNFFFH